MNRLIWFVFLLFSCISTQATEPAPDVLGDLPPDLLVPCRDREGFAKKVEEANNDEVAGTCKTQITDSVAECFKDPSTDNMESILKMVAAANAQENSQQPGFIRAAEETIKAYKISQERYEKVVQICIEEKKKIEATCSEMVEDLKKALRQNNVSADEYRAQVRSIPSNYPDRRAAQEDLARTQEVSLQLQTQMDKTVKAKHAALNAADISNQCHTNQALIYQHAADKTQTTLIALQHNMESQKQHSNGTKGHNLLSTLNSDAAGSAILDKSQEMAAGTAAESLADAVKKALPRAAGAVAEHAAKTVGIGFAAKSVAEGDPVAAIGNLIDVGAVYTMTPYAAMLVGGFTTAAAIIMKSSPAAACGTLNLNPIEAYYSKCSLQTIGGQQAQHNALQTLSQ